jgi:Arc/MetJ family transcription regulator
MRTTITIDDDLLRELLALTETDNRTAAINAAIEGHVRRLKLEGLRDLAGQVDIASNDELEAADLEEAERAMAGLRA